LQRGASNVDQSVRHHLKSAIAYREVGKPAGRGQRNHLPGLFGTTIPPHPTWSMSRRHLRRSGTTLRAVDEELIDLPLDERSGNAAAMDMLSALLPPASLPTTNCSACCVPPGLNVSVQHGTTGASALALWLLRSNSRQRSRTVTVRVIVSPSWHAT